MVAIIIKSGHSDLRPGQTGDVLHPHAGGWAVLFHNVRNQFASAKARNIVAWVGPDEVELSPNDPFPESARNLQLSLPLL